MGESYRNNTDYEFSLDYSLTLDQDFSLSLETKEFKAIKKPDILIPVSIFRTELSSLQAIVVYLKDNLKLRYCNISKLLNRNQRTIWATYAAAKKLLKSSLEIEYSELDIPISLFHDRKISVLEHIVHYLRSFGQRYNQISRELNLDQRTVWTAAKRAEVKLKHAV